MHSLHDMYRATCQPGAGFSAQQAGQHMGFTNPFGRASQDGLFGVEGNHLRGNDQNSNTNVPHGHVLVAQRPG